MVFSAWCSPDDLHSLSLGDVTCMQEGTVTYIVYMYQPAAESASQRSGLRGNSADSLR